MVEAYLGVIPPQLEECTYDQIFLMIAPMEQLKALWGGTSEVSPTQAHSQGLLPDGYVPYRGGKSYLMRLREEKERERQELIRQEAAARKRERRKRKAKNEG